MVSPDIGLTDLNSDFSALPYARESEIVIGLINNMPLAAMKRTEDQFARLLASGANGRKIRLKRFRTNDNSPAPDALSYEQDGYATLDALWESRLDGLIVTGTEPVAESMTSEPVWPMLAKLADWAAHNTISTIWSCFAAHAAVLRLDGISREKLNEKLSGVFVCKKLSEHSLVSGAPSDWHVPHSRYNTLSGEALSKNGYTILSYAPNAGPDCFIKPHASSLFVFFQGHPEYGNDILLREYCRDIDRYLSGQRSIYPCIPSSYFDQATISAFTALQDAALRVRDRGLLSALDLSAIKILNQDWRAPAVNIYSNWLSYIASKQAGYADSAVHCVSNVLELS